MVTSKRSAKTSSTRKKPASISKKTLKELHVKMVRIRRFEEEAGRMMEDGQIPGALHLYVGEEAVAAGVMQHLSNEDQIASTHRGHGHMVAKGGQFKPMYAELFGRATGYCEGKGGSMHLCDMNLGMLGANGIVGGGPPIAMGAAFSNKFHKTNNVAVAFFGDGAANEGSVHEAMNMAAVFELPCIFVCENNGYGEFTAQADHMKIENIADRAAAYGMPGVVVDGMDVLSVYNETAVAVERARNGGGPTLLECKTYRYYDHVGVRGMGIDYRTQQEIDEWKHRDAIESFERYLVEQAVMSEKQIQSVHKAVDKDIEEAIAYAMDSPHPETSELMTNVYSDA